MTEKIYSNPDIYIVHVPLPENPLRNLNCYVIKGTNKNLIIDTGFNLHECYEALKNGLEELEIDMSKTELFLTHLHSDHVGLAGSIMPEGGKIYISEIDYNYLEKTIHGEEWDVLDSKFLSEGFPNLGIQELHEANPARAFAPDERFKGTVIADGEIIKVDDYEFECIFTPGHTPGHMCLYYKEDQLLFTGDHVLFNITPNITFWNYVDNSLLTYLKSLDKIKKVAVKTALPSHRTNVGKGFYERIDEIIHHHQLRLDECLKIVKETPNLHSYDIAGKMQWSMRGKSWDFFPMGQKWFAVGETIAHLDYLIAENKIEKNLVDGIYYYK